MYIFSFKLSFTCNNSSHSSYSCVTKSWYQGKICLIDPKSGEPLRRDFRWFLSILFTNLVRKQNGEVTFRTGEQVQDLSRIVVYIYIYVCVFFTLQIKQISEKGVFIKWKAMFNNIMVYSYETKCLYTHTLVCICIYVLFTFLFLIHWMSWGESN